VSDVRPAVKEQVQSLGAKFIEVPVGAGSEDSGGYAREQSEEFLQRQRTLVRERIRAADVVITTAAVPGKKAPMLVPEDTVIGMKPGSVIVDLAVETGGNCALSERGKIVRKHGVTIIGLNNVPSLLPYHATEMYARNILNLLGDLIEKGALVLSQEDEVVRGALVCQNGEILAEDLRPATANKTTT
jgi:NAD(P) transhydrogenase subunit alpha